MKTPTRQFPLPADAVIAEKALYTLHNGCEKTAIITMQQLAQTAYNGGSRSILVLCYANGETNGRNA